MSRRSSNDTAGILLLVLIIIALPIVLFIWLIKACVNASKKVSYEVKKHNTVKSTNTTKTFIIDSSKKDEVTERTVFDDLADQVRDLNTSAKSFLLGHQCTKCGKNLYDCKCKGKIEIEKIDNYWETHCESCGELLKDCECDWKEQSKQDISQDMDDLDFDEMNDVWDEMDEDDGDL